MIIRGLRSSSDIDECVRLYMAHYDCQELPASYTASYSSFMSDWKNRCLIRIVEEDGEIIAWIIASRAKLEHMDKECVLQKYLANKTTGFKAFTVLRLLHNEMLKYANKMNIPYCISSGSHLDDPSIFTRLLEKCGWKRRGYLAIFNMRDYDDSTYSRVNRRKT